MALKGHSKSPSYVSPHPSPAGVAKGYPSFLLQGSAVVQSHQYTEAWNVNTDYSDFQMFPQLPTTGAKEILLHHCYIIYIYISEEVSFTKQYIPKYYVQCSNILYSVLFFNVVCDPLHQFQNPLMGCWPSLENAWLQAGVHKTTTSQRVSYISDIWIISMPTTTNK